MRKIYSLVLLAVGLLIGTNAWAQNTISLEYYGGAKADQTFATLQEAIDYVNPGDSATITLTANQTLNEGILIPHVTSVATDADKIVNRAGQRICIDLGGKTIKMTSGVNHTLFSLIKGTLRFTGKGTIKREAARNAGNVFHRCAIVVTGADANKNDATKDRSKQVWSTLYVDKDVTVIGHGNDCFGIGLNNIGDVLPDFAGFNKDFLGYTCYQPHGTGNMWDPTTSGYQFSAFGARLYIDGTVDGTVRGINILGSLNQTPGIVEGATARKYAAYPYYDHYFPYVKIGKNADVYCEPSGINDNGNGGIYLGGWAVVDIEGAVHGQTGIMVKAGDVLVQNGSVYSDSPNFNTDGNYHGTVEGSGIFVTSSASYAGESSVTITGDSYIAGNGGCAIIDVCATSTSEATPTAVTHIDITGGTIVAGDKGAISLGAGTEVNTDITGGIVEGKVDIGDASDTDQRFHTDITGLLPNTNDYHTTVIKDEEGNQTIVISKGGTPTPVTEWTDIAALAEGSDAKWTGLTAGVIGDGINPATIKLGELQIVSGYKEADPSTTVHKQVLTVKDKATLITNKLIMNDYAQIIVEAGGKLIVEGKQGINAPSTDNIVLHSTASKYAIFLFNPSVESNKHPNATVEYVATKSFYEGSEYQWERFGVPTWTTLKSIECTTDDWTNFQVFENGDWVDLGWFQHSAFENVDNTSRFNKPFATYNLLTDKNKSADAATYVMKGELVGNMDATLNANLQWNPFTNSYSAELDVKEMLLGLANANYLKTTVYLAESQGNGHYAWNAIDLNWIDKMPGVQKLAPMQAFILNNEGLMVEDFTLDYEKMVWDPVMDPAHTVANGAPRRAGSANDYSAMLRINVSSEQGAMDNVKLMESTVNNNNAVKYMNNDVNIYAQADKNYAIVAAEDLEDTYFGFSTVNGGEFTISFANVEGREFDLIDLETGVKVAVKEGETYSFAAAANTVADYRFKLVERAKLPTAIENTEAVKSVKGIYTITGQYLGEMNVWNTLPAGVYVVNGEKLVK